MFRNRVGLKTCKLVFMAMVVGCFLLSNVWAEADYTPYKLFYSKAQKNEALRIIQEKGGLAPEFDPKARFVVLYLTPEEAQEYLKKGFQLEEFRGYHPLQSRSIYIEDRGIPGYPCYRTVAETIQAIQKIAQDYPDLATLKDVGDSYLKTTAQGGYDIYALVLTNKSITIQKPALMGIGGIHARELVTAETWVRFAEYLVSNYGKDPDVTWILDNHEIHILPQVNPDGRIMAESGILWRKNRHKHDNNNCSNTSSSQYGADLNRNFPYKWNTAGTNPTNVCAETYPGKSAGSEPETKAVRDYYLALFKDFNTSPTSPASLDTEGTFLTLHSYSQLVLHPYGDTTNPPPNGQLQTITRKFAYFNNYTPQQSSALYPTSGTTDDDLYANYGIPSFTFEMGTAFFQDCASFESTIYPRNLQALIYAAKICRVPYRLAYGPDALNVTLNGNVLTATINDTRYNNSNGTEPTENIAAAEYYIDHPPWDNGTPIAMTAADGSFNSKIENATATINTSGLPGGRHTIFVRGKDANNNWGAFSAVFLNINTPPIPDFSVNAPGNATLEFTDLSTDPDPGDTIVSWQWNFGDGSGSTAQNVSHVYQQPYFRSYRVTLTITDKSGASASITKQAQFKP